MTTWNYRIVRYRDASGYGLHEVHYNEGGEPTGMTEEPISFTCGVAEGPEGIIKSLQMAYADAINRPTFEEPKVWKGEWT